MKKFLLFAAAALIVGSASAQLHRPTNVTKVSNNVVTKGEMKMMKDLKVDVNNAATFTNLLVNNDLRKGNKFAPNAQSFKAVRSLKKNSLSHRAADLQEVYNGTGIDYDTNESVSWQMSYTSGENEGTPYECLVDVIPLPEQWATLEFIPVDFTRSGNTITITPQCVVTSTGQDGTKYYWYIHSWTSEDGAIVLTLGDDGSLTTIDNEDIAYSAFSEDRFDLTKAAGIYKGYILDITKVRYFKEGQAVVPVAGYEPETLFLHPGPNVNANYYTNVLTPAYSDLSMINRTDIACTSYAWTAQEVEYNSGTKSFDPVGNPITGSSEDFSFFAKGGSTYQPVSLVATLEQESSEPFTWSKGQWFAGGMADDWQDESEPLLTFTKANPAGDLDIINPEGTKSTIFYQGKPASPLYFTGVSLFVYQFEKLADLNLICKIHKAHRDADGTFTLGELIAQSDLTDEGLETGTWMAANNLTKLNWTQFYVEDEEGMSQDVDYLQLDEEFAVVIEGWDNGSVSGYPLMFTSVNSKGLSSTFAIVPGEDTYTGHGWTKTSTTFVGFIDAIFGYLYTPDATDITLPEDGSAVSIHVNPMFYSNNSETGMPETAIWLAEDSDDIPDWLKVEATSPLSTEDISFDLLFSLNTGGEKAPSRRASEDQVTLKFEQWGGQLVVNVSRGGGQTDDYTDVTIASIADATAKVDKAKLTMTNAKVLYANGARVFVREGSKAALLYALGIDDLKTNATVSGTVKGKIDIYNNLPEFCKTDDTNADGLTITQNDTPAEPLEIDMANASNYVSDLVKFSGVTFTEVSGKNAVANLGSSSIKVFDQFGVFPASLEGTYDMTGIITVYKENLQIYPTEIKGATGISNINTDQLKDAPAYNVAGQRVNKNFKGLVVKDGRKFMNK